MADDFTEVIAQLGPGEGIVPLEYECVRSLDLSSAGRLAAVAVLADHLDLLRTHDLAYSLNCAYDCVCGPDAGVVPTDSTSFPVDSAPVEVDTWLFTYHGAYSGGLRNEDILIKVEIPSIRTALLKVYGGAEDAGFVELLREHSYDSHYAPKPGAKPYPFGTFTL